MSLAAISPDGNRIAHVSDVRGVRSLNILDLNANSTSIVGVSAIRPESLRWSDNDTVLLRASNAQQPARWRSTHDFTRAFAINIDNDFEVVELLGQSRDIGRNLNLGRLLGLSDNGERVLIPAYDHDDNLDLFAARTDQGLGTRVASGTHLTNYWIVGEDGQPVARIDRSERFDRQTLYVYDGNRARVVLDEQGEARPSYTAWGLLASGDLAISTTFISADSEENAGATRSLYGMSLEDGRLTEVVFQNDTFDMAGVIVDDHTNLVIGVTYEDVFPTSVWFDDELNLIQGALLNGIGADSVQLTSWSEDRTKLLALVQWADRPQETYFVDWPARDVRRIGISHDLPSDGSLPTRQSISYPARDGTMIPAYLTLPNADGPHPAVVLPHGGPASRDTGGFDYVAHFLASRGYAVIQPNFRGSDGYGHPWETAGYGEWGTGLMQHDLTDAANVLVSAGLADPDRLCIGGFSYGGYAALAGATFTPDLYQCAFAMAPVSDLDEMVDWVEDRYGRGHWLNDYWAELMVGSDESARIVFEAVSPAFHADQVNIPILLIHGDNDTVVPVRQSQIMSLALNRAGADVEFVQLDEADHWLTDAQTRLAVLSTLERFFDEHIGD